MQAMLGQPDLREDSLEIAVEVLLCWEKADRQTMSACQQLAT